jgi:hypothetical protein
MNRPECMSGSIAGPPPPKLPDGSRVEIEIEKSPHVPQASCFQGFHRIRHFLNRTVVMNLVLLRLNANAEKNYISIPKANDGQLMVESQDHVKVWRFALARDRVLIVDIRSGTLKEKPIMPGQVRELWEHIRTRVTSIHDFRLLSPIGDSGSQTRQAE